MVSIDKEVEQCALPAADCVVEIAEERARPALGPEGHAGEGLDALLMLREI